MARGLPTLDRLDLARRKVLLRLDLNVPVDAARRISDTTRIDRALPTLRALAERGARTVILSHFGRPAGKVVDEMSLGILSSPLSTALGRDVAFAPDCIGAGARAIADSLDAGAFALLENLRFHAGEEANDPGFARSLASVGDVYVNDAFSVSHRAHASTVGLPSLMPHAAGPAMQAELNALDKALGNPSRPSLAIVGGAKVSTKLAVLANLIGKVDVLAIGGAMANTFLVANDCDVGRSLFEPDMVEIARSVVDEARSMNCELLLPVDAVVAGGLEPGVEANTVPIDSIPGDQMILDIGPASAAALARRMADCRTVLWNGPVGAFETRPFDAATTALARHTAQLTRGGGLVSVAGGGDTIAALVRAGVADEFSYVSAAGGAFLEWLEGKTLPGIAALMA